MTQEEYQRALAQRDVLLEQVARLHQELGKKEQELLRAIASAQEAQQTAERYARDAVPFHVCCVAWDGNVWICPICGRRE